MVIFDLCSTDFQVTINGVGDRQADHTVHIYQSGQFIPIMHYNAVAESAEITYTHYNDGAWQGLIWTGGATEVQWLNIWTVKDKYKLLPVKPRNVLCWEIDKQNVINLHYQLILLVVLLHHW